MKYSIRIYTTKKVKPGLKVESYSREDAIEKCREYLSQGYVKATIIPNTGDVADEEIFLPCNAEEFIEKL